MPLRSRYRPSPSRIVPKRARIATRGPLPAHGSPVCADVAERTGVDLVEGWAAVPCLPIVLVSDLAAVAAAVTIGVVVGVEETALVPTALAGAVAADIMAAVTVGVTVPPSTGFVRDDAAGLVVPVGYGSVAPY